MVLFVALTLRRRRLVLALHKWWKLANESNQGNRQTKTNGDRIIYTNQKIISNMEMKSVDSFDKPIARIYYIIAVKIQIIINSIFQPHHLIIFGYAIWCFAWHTNFTNILHKCSQKYYFHKVTLQPKNHTKSGDEIGWFAWPSRSHAYTT